MTNTEQQSREELGLSLQNQRLQNAEIRLRLTTEIYQHLSNLPNMDASQWLQEELMLIADELKKSCWRTAAGEQLLANLMPIAGEPHANSWRTDTFHCKNERSA